MAPQMNGKRRYKYAPNLQPLAAPKDEPQEPKAMRPSRIPYFLHDLYKQDGWGRP
jgi:hypothetical protein